VDADDASTDGQPTGGSSSAAGQAKDTVKDTASQAKDTAKETAGQAKEQAKQVGSTAADAGQRVASTTKDQASKVASDAVGQARELYSQATEQLSEQAAKQKKSAAEALRTLSSDLASMHEQQGGSGLAAELVQNVSQRADSVAEWLEDREPGDVLHEVRQFAARRPGFFIGLAAVAGIVAARATKALVADAKPELTGGSTSGSGSRAETTGPNFDAGYTDATGYTEGIGTVDVDDPYGSRTYGATGSYGAGLGDVR
jgi:gas vesicle protein